MEGRGGGGAGGGGGGYEKKWKQKGKAEAFETETDMREIFPCFFHCTFLFSMDGRLRKLRYSVTERTLA